MNRLLQYSIFNFKMSRTKKIVGPHSTKKLDRIRAQWEEVYLTLEGPAQIVMDDFEISDLFADKDVDEATARYQNLVSLMLSALTRYKINIGNLNLSRNAAPQETRPNHQKYSENS